MPKVEKILFPIDFSEKFETFLPWVSTFVEKFGATLYVMFVAQDLSEYTSFYVPHTSIQGFQEETLAAAQKKMTATAQEFLKGFPKLETRVTVGSPAQKILELANQEKIDLIIMATHGRKGLERTIFGSVADQIVLAAPCPVVTIRS
ncbi:MAG: universal stress protein [Deltaproteobacteria bacterium]|nr:MAG: universal stress protein [Deltaproteobacteria bacterium]